MGLWFVIYGYVVNLLKAVGAGVNALFLFIKKPVPVGAETGLSMYEISLRIIWFLICGHYTREIDPWEPR